MSVSGVGPTGPNLPSIPPTSGIQAFSVELLSKLSAVAADTQVQLLTSQLHDLMTAVLASKIKS